MGERIGRIGRIYTDFSLEQMFKIGAKSQKIRLNLPNPPNPFSHCITRFQNDKRLDNQLIIKPFVALLIPKSEIHIPKSAVREGFEPPRGS
jgi:hypothetical protein